MKTVLRYRLPQALGEHEIELPFGAQPLSVQMQDGRPYLWAEVDDGNELESRRIVMSGTGHALPWDDDTHLEWQHIGTVLDEPHVWHYFIGDPE